MSRQPTPPGRPSPAAGWYPDPSRSKNYAYWDGSAWRPDITAAINRTLGNHAARYPLWLRSRVRRQIFLGQRALVRIGTFVPSDERVEHIAVGTWYSWRWGNRTQTAYVVLTDRRLLLLIGSPRRATLRDYPLKSISFAESGSGGIVVVANGQELRIAAMNRDDADDIAHAIQDRLSGRRTGPARPAQPVADDLGKIKRWRVTEE